MTKAPIDPVDVLIGGRVRDRREALKLTQAALADAIGVTFQQVQKYERGVNRIAAARLLQIATRLETHVSRFYDGPDAEEISSLTPAESRVVHYLRRATVIEVQATTSLLRALTVGRS